jgi:hypothetical protein
VNEHTRWVLHSTLSPEEVTRALIDFGPERAQVWRETSHPQVYSVHRVGSDWAEVTEGVPFSWSRERYDWSVPGRVVLEQLDSNVALPGGRIAYSITPTAGGSLITCDRRRRFLRTPRGILAAMLMRSVGPVLLRRQFDTALRRVSDMSSSRSA